MGTVVAPRRRCVAWPNFASEERPVSGDPCEWLFLPIVSVVCCKEGLERHWMLSKRSCDEGCIHGRPAKGD